MKSALSFLLIALMTTFNLSAISSSNRNMKGLKPYLSPETRVKTVAQPDYLPDGLSYLAVSDDGKRIVKCDTKNGNEIETVMDLTHTRETTLDRMQSYKLSPDGSKILICTERVPIYRRSFKAKYYVYEIRTRILRPLSETHAYQRAPIFSPDGRMVAFVGEDNNIYLKKIDFNTEVPVTTDGKIDHVINGVPDWVYEEEFSSSSSMAWAPDNMTLSYLKYNETNVPAYSFPLYEGTCDPLTQYALYPGAFTYKYPVAGEPNSVVSIHSYDVDTRKTKDITLPDDRIEYIPRIHYGGAPERLIAVTLNRDQTRLEIFSVNPRSNVSKSLMVEEDKAWIEPCTYEDMKINKDNFVILSARSGYIHAYQYSYSGTMTKQITSGDFDVTAYYGVDANGNHYYQSTACGPINRVISRIDVKGVEKHITPTTGTASAWFTPAMNYYTVNYNNSTTPPTYTLYTIADKQVRVLADNSEVAQKYASTPKKEFLTITTADGVSLNAYMIKPADFNSSKKYPLIMHQYSGPGSQQVLDTWQIDWMQYAVTQGYIVLVVDPRGTGGRGREWETIVYKNLGHYETIDQQGAARYMASLPYIDGNRIGICGWSYGGYETIMSVSTPNCPFAAGVAIAPVTDWRYYDTIYAERYMLTPKQNEDGYEDSAPLNHVENMNVPLLIMHGTADDNVHLMNTIQYVSRLQAAGRFCDMFLFPNMNHSIYNCNARMTVYTRLIDYFNKNL
ncbi:MAG: DPP IV N-terminal domain-containing protein [Duncaniella sp.]|nr:DPP IV N-terminal domain-containing protein [Muribaculum sp.]MCM1254636.1 DPP IV N-terminal domain-containing protein [Duncaniella sp.]